MPIGWAVECVFVDLFAQPPFSVYGFVGEAPGNELKPCQYASKARWRSTCKFVDGLAGRRHPPFPLFWVADKQYLDANYNRPVVCTTPATDVRGVAQSCRA